MGCLQSRHRTGLYDDHELLDNLNFEGEENVDMAWEDDVLIAAVDDVVESSTALHSAQRMRPNSRILTSEEIQRITREKMNKIVAEQQHHDIMVDAALAQADEDQRLEEEAEIQSAKLRARLKGKVGTFDFDFGSDTQDQGHGPGPQIDDKKFEDFLEDVKSKSLLETQGLATPAGAAQGGGGILQNTIADHGASSSHADDTSLEDTVLIVPEFSPTPQEREENDEFDDFVEVDRRPVSAAASPQTPAPEEYAALSPAKAAPVPALDHALPDLDLPDLRELNGPLEASLTDFSFAE